MSMLRRSIDLRRCSNDLVLYISRHNLQDLLKAGKSGTEVLAWIREHSNRTEPEIMMWSEYQTQRSPSDAEGLDFYNESVQKILQHAGPECHKSQLVFFRKRNLNVKSLD
jgi:hypothetical protein